MDILDKIDAATASICGWCSAPLAEDGPSLDFCTLEHQEVWAARLGEAITGYREAGLGGMDMGEWSPIRMTVDMLMPGQSSTVRDAPALARVHVTPDLSGFTASLTAARRAAEGLALCFGLPARIPFEAPRAGTSPELIGIELISIDETRNWSAAETEGTSLNPMQTAIELRCNRNTGPALRRRAPKNIGWGRP